jgi:predicted RNA-binding protein with PUA-like domain
LSGLIWEKLLAEPDDFYNLKAARCAAFSFAGRDIPEAAMQYWLMKSEPSEVSIDDLAKAPKQTVPWFGVRNYTARNFMRDQMKVGDLVFFYHSSCPEPGIAGIAKVANPAHPDLTQFDPKSHYYDAGAKKEEPRWVNVDVKLVEKTKLISLESLRGEAALKDMMILKRGNRLSITPVTAAEWKHITGKMMGVKIA